MSTKAREIELKDKQKKIRAKRERDGARKQERWKGCCHSPAASPDNPSSLHMIISEAANEAPMDI